MRLYRVTCKGMTSIIGGESTAHGCVYVVAYDPSEAYRMVRAYLDKHGWGFPKDRAMDRVELLAEEGLYPDCGYHLLREG
ncbi:MAG: hypothetical protein WC322_06965 [Candidatus Paceibacterota bacterium]